ncbi:MAG: TetR/AcrR family transcriptional regulator [Oscillospiraceae bacterium]
MNIQAISKDALLDAAQDIVQTSGFEALSIRHLADVCKISVGCIYNYFPSKSQIIFSLTERFWAKTFHEYSCQDVSDVSFVKFIDNMYVKFSIGLEGFSSTLLQQMSLMKINDKQIGKNIEQNYMKHMKQGLLDILNNDKSVNENVFCEDFTKEMLIDFVFDNMLLLLRAKRDNCAILQKVICLLLYDIAT